MNTIVKPHYHLQCSHDEYRLITRALSGVLTQEEKVRAIGLCEVIMKQAGIEMDTYNKTNTGAVEKVQSLKTDEVL